MKTKSFTRCVALAWMLAALPGLGALPAAESVRLYFDPATPQIVFAAGDIKAALEKQKYTVQSRNLAALAEGGAGKALSTTTRPGLSYWVLGGDAAGAMYGGMQLAGNLSSGGFSGSFESEESPYLLNRGMKLNLPLDRRIPTYVGKWTSNSAKKAIPHVWDMSFWKELIDQQARNRYNVLSVWVHHPFPALVSLPVRRWNERHPGGEHAMDVECDGQGGEGLSEREPSGTVQSHSSQREVLYGGMELHLRSAQEGPQCHHGVFGEVCDGAHVLHPHSEMDGGYYAHKIRGATYKKAGATDKAREEMGQAYCWWMTYSRAMDSTYHADSFRNLSIAPDWKFGDAAVVKEYADLGGVGIPGCASTPALK